MKNQLLSQIFLLLILTITSCASSTSTTQLRELASENQTCQEIVTDIIKNEVKGKNNFYPSLLDIIKQRSTLKERYLKIAESIKEFDIAGDLPVKGQAKLLLDPKEGYLAKILLIRNAKKTLDLSYYIFKNDDTGKTILHEIRHAINRGVKVRILVDSSGSISKAPFYDDIKALVALSGRPILDEAGNLTGEFTKAEAVLFNPVFNIRAHIASWYRIVHNLFASENKRLPAINFAINSRSHDKIILADAASENSMAIIGGRNIADHYYAVGEGSDNPIIDAEILLKGITSKDENGQVYNSLEEHYNKIYYYLANKNFENFLFKTNRETARKEFKRMRESAKRLIGPNAPLADDLERMKKENFLENNFEEGMISIINEIQNLSRTKIFFEPQDAHNKKNGNSLIHKLRKEIINAEKSLDIVSPYFWIPDEEVDFLMDWAAKHPGRKVRIFANSISTTDNIVAQAMVDATFENTIMKKIKDTPVENQFEIYSYGRIDDKNLGGDKNYGFLHAKIVVIDGKSITISTSNLDPISRHLNSEIGTMIKDLPENSKNIKKLEAYIEHLQKNSTLWGTDEWHQVRNHPQNRIMKILESFITKIIYTLNLVPIL